MRRVGHTCAGVILIGSLLAGCGGDDDAAPEATATPVVEATETPTSPPEPTATEVPTATPEPTPTPEPQVAEEAIAGFAEATVVFGNVEYTATRAVVTNQELRSYAEGTDPEVDEGARYLVVDVLATNLLGSTQIGLDDGQVGLGVGDIRLPLEQGFLSDITAFIQPGSSVRSFVAFALGPDDDPATAELVFGAAPDRLASIPLTAPVPELGYPIGSAIEGQGVGVGPTNGGTLVFELQEALVSIDLPHEAVTSPTGQRADVGEVFVRLHVTVEKTEGRGNDLLRDAFRLVVDGVPTEPFDVAEAPTGSNGTATAVPGAVVDAWVLFLAPVDAAELALQVGAFDEEPGLIPLELELGTPGG